MLVVVVLRVYMHMHVYMYRCHTAPTRSHFCAVQLFLERAPGAPTVFLMPNERHVRVTASRIDRRGPCHRSRRLCHAANFRLMLVRMVAGCNEQSANSAVLRPRDYSKVQYNYIHKRNVQTQKTRNIYILELQLLLPPAATATAAAVRRCCCCPAAVAAAPGLLLLLLAS